jgi:hypothetical protein
MKNFTPNQNIIRLLYGEVSQHEASQIRSEIESNCELLEEYRELQMMANRLDKEAATPSESSIRIIMKHSYKTQHLQAF